MAGGMVAPCGCGGKTGPPVVGGRRAEWPMACKEAQAAAKDGWEEGECENGELICPGKPLIEPPTNEWDIKVFNYQIDLKLINLVSNTNNMDQSSNIKPTMSQATEIKCCWF